LSRLVSDYAFGKLTPTIGLAKELFTGEAFPARPLPWSREKGTPSQPKMWTSEFIASHLPILSQTPSKYFFDQLRRGGTDPQRYVFDQLLKNGMSAVDAGALVKGLIISAIGATGVHIGVEKPSRAELKKEKAARVLQGR
jgi:hypothetical protein